MIIDCVGAAERWWECMCTNFHMCVCANVFLRVCVCQRVGCAFERVTCMCAKYNENYTHTHTHRCIFHLCFSLSIQTHSRKRSTAYSGDCLQATARKFHFVISFAGNFYSFPVYTFIVTDFSVGFLVKFCFSLFLVILRCQLTEKFPV